MAVRYLLKARLDKARLLLLNSNVVSACGTMVPLTSPMKVIFETDKLLFRTWTADDVDHACKLWGDPEVMKFIDARGGLARDMVEKRMHEEIARVDLQYWMVFDRASGDFIGCCGLKPWTWSAVAGTEIGFYLAREKWGRGFGFECARAVVDYARELKLAGLLAGHHPENHGSRKILTRLGFKYTGDLHFRPTGLMHPCYELNFKPHQ
jgi:[ribosomal protein S5]-alanine N-acetyltransferase